MQSTIKFNSLMKRTYRKYFFIASTLLFANHAFAEIESKPICETHQTPLSVFAKNDMVFQNNDCRDGVKNYILEYLQRNNDKVFLFKQADDIGYDYDSYHVKAVSIFQPKTKSKPPVLIVLHGMENCCYPHPSGTFYNLKLFQIIDNQGKLQTKDITSILGKNNEGFEGQTDQLEKSHYSLKKISAIKRWLTKHY